MPQALDVDRVSQILDSTRALILLNDLPAALEYVDSAWDWSADGKSVLELVELSSALALAAVEDRTLDEILSAKGQSGLINDPVEKGLSLALFLAAERRVGAGFALWPTTDSLIQATLAADRKALVARQMRDRDEVFFAEGERMMMDTVCRRRSVRVEEHALVDCRLPGIVWYRPGWEGPLASVYVVMVSVGIYAREGLARRTSAEVRAWRDRLDMQACFEYVLPEPVVARLCDLLSPGSPTDDFNAAAGMLSIHRGKGVPLRVILSAGGHR